MQNARHVLVRSGILHAITWVLILGVDMACNTNKAPDGSLARVVADIP
jgi:hypothetical protein